MGTDPAAHVASAAEWDRRYSGPDLQWGSGPNARFADEAAGLVAGRALDLGAGEGRNAIWLAEHGWDVTAVDFSAVALDRAATLADERGATITTVVAALDDYVPEAGAYDLVALVYLQVPNPPFGDIVRRAADAVAPGGTFLLVNHDASNLAHGFGGPQNPALLTDLEVVTANLGDLAVERAEVVERVVTDAAGEHVALDAFVRARRAPA